MASLIGWNVEGMFSTAQEWDRLLAVCKDTQPAVMLVINNPQRALMLKQRLPQAEVIYRQTVKDEESAWRQISPKAWLDMTLAWGKKGLTLHSPNEPGQLDDTLCNWLVEFGRLCVQNNVRAVIGNFSVGMPHETTWAKYPQLLQLIAENRGYLRLGLHEYAPHLMAAEYTLEPRPSAWPKVPSGDNPYIVGRFRRVPADVPIIFTEFGWDNIRSEPFHSWQQALGVGARGAGYLVAAEWWGRVDREGLSVPAYAAQQVQWAFDQFYRRDPRVMGVCFFTWGNHGDWRTYYNVSDQYEFHDALKRGNLSVQTITHVVQNSGTQKTSARVTGIEMLNVRAQPHTQSPAVGQLRPGDIVEYFSDSEAVSYDASGSTQYLWYRTAAGFWFARVPSLVLIPVGEEAAKLRQLIQDARSALAAAEALLKGMD